MTYKVTVKQQGNIIDTIERVSASTALIAMNRIERIVCKSDRIAQSLFSKFGYSGYEFSAKAI